MDPLTHTLIGAAAARVVTYRLGTAALLPGACGALLPDADAFIRSSADPLLYAEYHRHFTHALAFIPVGGTIASLPWLAHPRTRPRWPAFLAAAITGYATHGVLDASTTYGTRLWWPFSDDRVAWNLISIIDPVFTIVVLAGVILAAWRGAARHAAGALALCAVMLGIGAIQQARALDVQKRMAEERGHPYERGAVFPGFGNSIVWRSLYSSGGVAHMDRIRVPWWSTASWRPGPMALLLTETSLDARVTSNGRLLRDFHRFRQFTAGWVARPADEPNLIADARYSSSVDRFEPVWGIRFVLTPREASVEWVDRSRQRQLGLGALWTELRGDDPRHRLLPDRR